MAAEGVPYIERPFRAWLKLSAEHRCAYEFRSPTSAYIFKWFEESSPAGAHFVPHFFVGTFYFDAGFWPVAIPYFAGQQMLDGRKAVSDMPDAIWERLVTNNEHVENFKALWADCLDYGVGVREFRSQGVSANEPWRKFLLSADKELNATVSMLCRFQPESKAIESARMAVEMFLKAALCHAGMSYDAAVKLSHRLDKSLTAVLDKFPDSPLRELFTRLDTFPPVSDRYEAKEYGKQQLWLAYKLAQFTGAEFVRTLTGRNLRAQIASRF
jgi:hypothetical protein